jgi:hypothetical protein
VGFAVEESAGTSRRLSGFRRALADFLVHLAVTLVALGAAEGLLRVLDFRDLRDGYGKGYPVVFRHDAELGWSPIPNPTAEFHGTARTIKVQHNSLGLRDVEPEADSRPTLLVLGDSLVWGYDVEAEERFTELLRKDLPDLRIINAGIPGYGTDQEYLLLQRIWSAVRPDIILLVFCVSNDREDNTSNVRYGGYLKPYFEKSEAGEWRVRGQPVPWSRFAYFNDNALVHNVWLARLAVSAYVQVRYPAISVADPTEQIVRMMRTFIENRSARFLVGLQHHEPKLEAFLQAEGIRYASFDGAATYEQHWTPSGHTGVAANVKSLLDAAGVTKVAHPAVSTSP